MFAVKRLNNQGLVTCYTGTVAECQEWIDEVCERNNYTTKEVTCLDGQTGILTKSKYGTEQLFRIEEY